MCFLIGCSDLLAPEVLKRNTNNLVVHESNLPEGRGWSPLTWQVLAGRNVITVSLLEVQEKVDSGPIYMQTLIELQGHELVGELRNKQAAATLKLCHDFVSNFPLVLSNAKEQSGEASYFPRRHPNDSELDPDKTISEQFNLLRVVDNDQYPAFFVMNGCKYILKIEKEQSDKS